MGQALSASLRLKIIKARTEEKLSYRAIAARFGINHHSVGRLCKAYEEHGRGCLVPDYSNCGKKISTQAEKVYRLVRLVRHFHSEWGVPYILTRIEVAYPNLVLQSHRTYQRRLKKDCPKPDLPPPTVPRAPLLNDVRQAHDEWQLDAKEQIKLGSGQEVCYLNTTDTKSHALLKAKPFPPAVDTAGSSGSN